MQGAAMKNWFVSTFDYNDQHVQGLSSQLSGLQTDISQPPEQLEIGLKHQYVPYSVQFYTYFFIIH